MMRTSVGYRHDLAAVAVGLAIVILLLVWSAAVGMQRHALGAQQEADERDIENQRVCERLSFPLGSTGYAACASEADWIRTQHERRLGVRSGDMI